MLYSIRKIAAAGIVAAAVSLAASLPAHADVTFTPGNHPQPDEENILFKNAAMGSMITGETNMSKIPVNFSSSTDILVQGGMGQADVYANDGTLENISISIPNGYYTDLIIDPETVMGKDKTPGGTADVTVYANDGTFMDSYPISTTGSNFLTIYATDGESILSTSITMEGDGSFAGLKQPRISGAALGTPPVVPEPGSLALLTTGMLPLLGGVRRRFRG